MVTFKWSSIDKALLPALSGVVKNLFDGAKLGNLSISSKYFGTFFVFSALYSKKICTFVIDN